MNQQIKRSRGSDFLPLPSFLSRIMDIFVEILIVILNLGFFSIITASIWAVD